MGAFGEEGRMSRFGQRLYRMALREKVRGLHRADGGWETANQGAAPGKKERPVQQNTGPQVTFVTSPPCRLTFYRRVGCSVVSLRS